MKKLCRDCPEWRSISGLYGARMEKRDLGQCRHERDDNGEVITDGKQECIWKDEREGT